MNFIFLIGQLEDNVLLLTYHNLLSKFGVAALNWINYPTGASKAFIYTSQPLMWQSFTKLTLLFNEIIVYNSLIILGLLLTFLKTRRFFLVYIKNSIAATLSAFIFVASPYFYYQSRSHVDLVQFWTVLLFMEILFSKKGPLKYGLLGVIIAATLLISNYFGLLCLLILCFYVPIEQINVILTEGKKNILDNVLGYCLTFVVFFVLVIPFLAPFLGIGSTDTPELAQLVPDRPIADFVYFSAKPWFYVLPSVDNPLLGGVTTEFLSTLGTWNYFWVQNYFKSEHSTSFLGITNIVLILSYVVLRYKANGGIVQTLRSLSKTSRIMLMLAIVFAILSLPPYFTFNSFTVYLPSYFIFKYLPMFRVLSRLSTVVLLVVCWFVGLIYKDLLLRRQYVLVVMLFVLSVMEFFIPLKFIYAKGVPEVYTYINDYTQKNSVVAVYPYSELTSGLFWLREFNRPLVNSRGFIDPVSGFNSETFTKNLTSREGITDALNIGVTHIVYFGVKPACEALASFDSYKATVPTVVSDRILVVSSGMPAKRANVYDVELLLRDSSCTERFIYD